MALLTKLLDLHQELKKNKDFYKEVMSIYERGAR